jgi:hypothetical protein
LVVDVDLGRVRGFVGERFAREMKAAFVIVIVSVGVVLLAFHGVLMCVSPRRFYEFWRWSASLASPMVIEVPPGRHLDIRIVGFIFILMSILFGYLDIRAIIKFTS